MRSVPPSHNVFLLALDRLVALLERPKTVEESSNNTDELESEFVLVSFWRHINVNCSFVSPRAT